jgi:hypothetical protein
LRLPLLGQAAQNIVASTTAPIGWISRTVRLLQLLSDRANEWDRWIVVAPFCSFFATVQPAVAIDT